MVLYWIQAFNTAGESTTLAQMNQGTTATVANFNNPTGGTLRKVLVIVGSEAATSLVEDVRVELECTLWKPNRLHFVANGSGLRTAPAVQIGSYMYDVDQPLQTDVSIRGDYIHDSGVPVTSRIRVLFLVQA